jgi:hypothetical protein
MMLLERKKILTHCMATASKGGQLQMFVHRMWLAIQANDATMAVRHLRAAQRLADEIGTEAAVAVRAISDYQARGDRAADN